MAEIPTSCALCCALAACSNEPTVRRAGHRVSNSTSPSALDADRMGTRLEANLPAFGRQSSLALPRESERMSSGLCIGRFRQRCFGFGADNTTVVAAVYGPKAVVGWKENPERATIEIIWKSKSAQAGDMSVFDPKSVCQCFGAFSEY